MSMKTWEDRTLSVPGAEQRVADIEDELRLAHGLTALRERAGLSQRDVAKRAGVSQPRVAAIERSQNVTVAMLTRYVRALGWELHIVAVQDGEPVALTGEGLPPAKRRKRAAG